jgi:hypothetical protein
LRRGVPFQRSDSGRRQGIGLDGRFIRDRAVGLLEAAERVVRLYEACGRPEKAAAGKAKLGLADLPADVFVRP